MLAPTLTQLRVQQYIFFGPFQWISLRQKYVTLQVRLSSSVCPTRNISAAFLCYSSGPLTEEDWIFR